MKQQKKVNNYDCNTSRSQTCNHEKHKTNVGFVFFHCHTKSNSETFYVSADVLRLNQPSKNACWLEGGCVSYLVCDEQASAGHS